METEENKSDGLLKIAVKKEKNNEENKEEKKENKWKEEVDMSKWDKLISRIYSLSKDMRFGELRKILESCGYTMNAPRSGSSHYTFRKPG